LDPVQLVVIGDRREPHHLPRLLLEHVAGEVVPRVMPEGRLSCRRCMINTMAPESLSLSRLERGWAYHSLAAPRWVCEGASAGFSGSSMTIKSAPRPVKTPPTEVATREPCAVVSNSGAACGEELGMIAALPQTILIIGIGSSKSLRISGQK